MFQIIETCPCVVEIHQRLNSSPVCVFFLSSGLSLMDRTLLCLLARHQVSAIAVTLPSSLSPFLFLSLCCFFLCLEGERRHLKERLEFIEMDLVCCLLQPDLHKKKSSFLLYSFFMSFSPSVRSPGLSCLRLSRQLTAR